MLSHTSASALLTPLLSCAKLQDGYRAASTTNLYIYCLSIVRHSPSLTSAHTQNRHTQRALPATLHESSGQRSPVASGRHDDSLAVPRTGLKSSSNPPPYTHHIPTHKHKHSQRKRLLSPDSPVHHKRPWSASFSPNVCSRAAKLFPKSTAVEVPPQLQCDQR